MRSIRVTSRTSGTFVVWGRGGGWRVKKGQDPPIAPTHLPLPLCAPRILPTSLITLIAPPN